MSTRLDAAPQDSENARVGRSEDLRGKRGHCGGAPSRNDAAIQRGQRLACFGAEKQDHRLVRTKVSARIAGKNGDEFGAHHVLINGRHEAEPTRWIGGGENSSDRLHNFSSRKRNQCISHRQR